MHLFRNLIAAASIAGAVLAHAAEPHATYGSWSLECTPAGQQGAEVCILTQKVAADREGKRVLLGVIVDLPADSMHPRIAFRFARDANPEHGAGLKIGAHEPLRIRNMRCDDEVCESTAWLSPEYLKQFKESEMAILAFVRGAHQVSLPFSLGAFSEAHAGLVAANGR